MRSKNKTIRTLNDRFRQTLIGGRVLITRGVALLPSNKQVLLLNAVRQYNKFSYKNDPYNEHDFGVITLAGQTYFWKIDYYDLAYRFLSPDPGDTKQTNRVLTIMTFGEY